MITSTSRDMKEAPKILLVEDDLNMGYLLTEFLEAEGFNVKLCKDGKSGITSFRRSMFDLCILDVMMPQMDGFSVAKQLKHLKPNIPFLFLTARSLKDDKLRGFAAGAEDYVTKPFDEEELLCRIRVLLKRHETLSMHNTALPEQFSIGTYVFDYSRQELRYKDQVWRMTEKENEVLRLLCLHRNQILRRDDAVEKIYGQRDYFLGRSFDVFISKLRKMLRHDPQISIDNVFKVGFILNVKEH